MQETRVWSPVATDLSLKKVMTVSLPNARQQKLVLCVLVNDHTRGPWATSVTSQTIPLNKHINFAQINDYAMTLRGKKSLSLIWKLNCWLFMKNWIPFTQRYIAPSLAEIGLVVLQKTIFRFNPPLENGVALHLNKLESSSPKNALCQVWLKLARWLWRIFLNFDDKYSLFWYYLPLEKGGPFIWKNLNSLYQVIFCAKFGWN